jgi:hypothetical protein
MPDELFREQRSRSALLLLWADDTHENILKCSSATAKFS